MEAAQQEQAAGTIPGPDTLQDSTPGRDDTASVRKVAPGDHLPAIFQAGTCIRS